MATRKLYNSCSKPIRYSNSAPVRCILLVVVPPSKHDPSLDRGILEGLEIELVTVVHSEFMLEKEYHVLHELIPVHWYKLFYIHLPTVHVQTWLCHEFLESCHNTRTLIDLSDR